MVLVYIYIYDSRKEGRTDDEDSRYTCRQLGLLGSDDRTASCLLRKSTRVERKVSNLKEEFENEKSNSNGRRNNRKIEMDLRRKVRLTLMNNLNLV